MSYQPQALPASRCLAGIACANTLSFSLANLLSLPVALTPLLYLLCLFAGLALFKPLHIRRNIRETTPGLYLLALGFALAVALPRAVYPTEWWSSQSVDAVFDDYARLAELVAMTLSDSYPLQHPASDKLLLSFYYAAFFPTAVLKLLLGSMTLKDCLFITSALYAGLATLSLLEISLRIGKGRWGPFILLLCCCWFGGLDWLTGSLMPIASHSEWWAQQLFDRPSQIAALPTTANWAIHHWLGFYLPVLAWIFWRECRAWYAWQKPVIVPLLLLSGLFHSPFGFLPVVVMGLPWVLILIRRYATRWSTLSLLLLALAPLPVFMGRLPGNTLQIKLPLLVDMEANGQGYVLSGLVYLAALPLIDLAALPFLLLLVWRHFSALEKYLAASAVLFFVSTLFLFMPLFNNYSMRGMLLPSFICFTLLSRHWQALIERGGKLASYSLVILLSLASIGGAREFASSIRYSIWAHPEARQTVLDEPPRSDRYNAYRIWARDASMIRLVGDPVSLRQGRPWLAEKRLPETKPGQLSLMERELARRPR